MIRNAAGPRRWMLWAAPLMALVGLRWGTGGAAAGLAIWMLLRPKPLFVSYPYSRKRKPAYHRLFLGFSACVFLLKAQDHAIRFLLPFQQLSAEPSKLLFLAGSIGFSLSLGQKAYGLPLKRRPAYMIAGFLLFLAFFLFLTVPESFSIP